MGYIELKTGQVALRSKKIILPEFTMPARSGWSSVTYGNGKYVAVANDDSAGAYSSDGINWMEMSMPASRKWSSVIYGNGKFVAVGEKNSAGLIQQMV